MNSGKPQSTNEQLFDDRRGHSELKWSLAVNEGVLAVECTDRFVGRVDGVKRRSVRSVDESVVDEELVREAQVHVVRAQLDLKDSNRSIDNCESAPRRN